MKAVLFISVVTLSLAGSAFAGGNHPCVNIKQACESAGFTKGGHKNGGKGLWEDCMNPMMKTGQAPAGVNASASDITACQQRKAKHHQQQQQSGSGSGAGASTGNTQ